jgi:glycosyltransferase involved in cell wall biosynthesis
MLIASREVCCLESTLPVVRFAVYCDFACRRHGGALWAEMAFVRFLGAVAEQLGGMTLVGRLDPAPGPWHHRVPESLAFEPLPHYASLADPRRALPTTLAALRRFWDVLGRVDAVWLFGPHPLALCFAVLAVARRRRVVLGVRQDLPAYLHNRHPGRFGFRVAAVLLESAYRLLARRCRVMVVGPALARHYAAARSLLDVTVSLVSEAELAGPEAAAGRRYDGDALEVLSVGRLDPEKNPLLLADVLAELVQRDARWRLVVCGEGTEAEALAERLRAHGLQDRAELAGYVPFEHGLVDRYRSAHAVLHIAWTEGVPQVLLEAFAQRVPVVATAVGGVRATAEGAALLVRPGDARECADALTALARDPALRARLVDAGIERARAHTLEAQSARVAAFLTATDAAV